LAANAGASGDRQDATVDPNVPLSFAHLAALDIGPPELIDLVAEAGYASTSIRMCRTVPGSPAYPLIEAGARRATISRLRATGVAVLYVELVALERGLDVSGLTPMLEIGAELGATCVLASGDDPDLGVVAEKLAAVADLAARNGMAVDLEFMPFRTVRSLSDAVDVIRRSGAVNGHVLVDALHFYRSGSSLDELRALEPSIVGTFQICDGPAAAPADLAFEARQRRLLPGHGELDLAGVVAALPAGVPIGVEVPMALTHPGLAPVERARLAARATRALLARLA
jgi:sugar phosphate isomerase/epimerase